MRAEASKYRTKVDMKMILPGDVIETPDDAGLFSLKTVDTKEKLKALQTHSTPDDVMMAAAAEDDDIFIEEGAKGSGEWGGFVWSTVLFLDICWGRETTDAPRCVASTNPHPCIFSSREALHPVPFTNSRYCLRARFLL